MKLNIRLFGLLALLMMGSAGLQAQSDDPFGDVNINKYAGNMNITSQVVQNGVVITDAVVAVYVDDELRGKGRVGAGTNPQLAYLTVHGDYEARYQYMVFKVYTNNTIFTFNPDPAIDFEDYFNKIIGSESNPFIIDITPVSLANDADNTSVVTTWDTKTCDVVLSDRTLYHDGAWNTLCLPFDVDAFTGTPLEGAIVKTLESTDFADGTLTMNFTADNANLTQIKAGKPYIVKWTSGENDENPVFSSVTIKNVTDNVPTTYADFVGTYSPVVYDPGTAHRDVLFLGGGSTLYYPDGKAATTIGSCRAYFTLKNGLTAGEPKTGESHVRSFVLDFGDNVTTGITTTDFSDYTDKAGTWYSLDGRRLSGIRKTRHQPLAPGIYLRKGKKLIVK